MNWLFEIVLEALIWLISWENRHTDRSIVGESRFDRQARIVAWLLIFLVAAGAILYFFILKK